MRNRGRHASAIISAIVGSGILAIALVGMNRKVHKPPKAKEKVALDLNVEEKKKKKPKKDLPKPKPQRRTTRSRPAPRPSFSGQLAGLGAGIPVFSAGDLAGLGGDSLSELETTKDMVMTADTVDSQPERIDGPNPSPPNRAIRQGITGYVRVRAQVTADGRLTGVTVVEAEPEGVFEEAVESALAQWRMKPATYGGNPVATTVSYTFRFQQ